MLNWQDKALTKIISLIVIQSFLFTGAIYPESVNNKDIAGIYKIDRKLRVPMAFGKDDKNAAVMKAVFAFIYKVKYPKKQPSIIKISGNDFNWGADAGKGEYILSPKFIGQVGLSRVQLKNLNEGLEILKRGPSHGSALFSIDQLKIATERGFQLYKGLLAGNTFHDNIPGINLVLLGLKDKINVSSYTRAFFMTHEFMHASGDKGEKEVYEAMVRFLVRYGIDIAEEVKGNILEIIGAGRNDRNLILELVNDVILQLKTPQDEDSIIENVQDKIGLLVDRSTKFAKELLRILTYYPVKGGVQADGHLLEVLSDLEGEELPDLTKEQYLETVAYVARHMTIVLQNYKDIWPLPDELTAALKKLILKNIKEFRALGLYPQAARLAIVRITPEEAKQAINSLKNVRIGFDNKGLPIILNSVGQKKILLSSLKNNKPTLEVLDNYIKGYKDAYGAASDYFRQISRNAREELKIENKDLRELDRKKLEVRASRKEEFIDRLARFVSEFTYTNESPKKRARKMIADMFMIADHVLEQATPEEDVSIEQAWSITLEAIVRKKFIAVSDTYLDRWRKIYKMCETTDVPSIVTVESSFYREDWKEYAARLIKYHGIAKEHAEKLGFKNIAASLAAIAMKEKDEEAVKRRVQWGIKKRRQAMNAAEKTEDLSKVPGKVGSRVLSVDQDKTDEDAVTIALESTRAAMARRKLKSSSKSDAESPDGAAESPTPSLQTLKPRHSDHDFRRTLVKEEPPFSGEEQGAAIAALTSTALDPRLLARVLECLKADFNYFAPFYHGTTTYLTNYLEQTGLRLLSPRQLSEIRIPIGSGEQRSSTWDRISATPDVMYGLRTQPTRALWPGEPYHLMALGLSRRIQSHELEPHDGVPSYEHDIMSPVEIEDVTRIYAPEAVLRQVQEAYEEAANRIGKSEVIGHLAFVSIEEVFTLYNTLKVIEEALSDRHPFLRSNFVFTAEEAIDDPSLIQKWGAYCDFLVAVLDQVVTPPTTEPKEGLCVTADTLLPVLRKDVVAQSLAIARDRFIGQDSLVLPCR